MGYLLGFLRFWRDFIIGDDWRIAAGVAVVLGVGGVLVAATVLSDALIAVAVTCGILLVVGVSLARAK